MSKFIIVLFVVGFAACAFADSDDGNSGGLLGSFFPGLDYIFGGLGKGSLFGNDMDKPIEKMTNIPKGTKYQGHEHKSTHTEMWENGKKVVDTGSEENVVNNNGDVKEDTSNY